MARKKISPELKAAIIELPIKEKDKLLMRLIPKGRNLVEQLEFKLLEGGETTEERRAEVDDEITALLNHYSHHHYVSRHSVSILRELSGKINHHISITKDKYGEAELNLKLINASFEFTDLQEGMLSRMVDEKYYDYVLRRLIKVLKIIGALHSDYHLDFSDRITEFYEIVKDNDALKVYAELHGLDVVDLEYGDVPEQYIKSKK